MVGYIFKMQHYLDDHLMKQLQEKWNNIWKGKGNNKIVNKFINDTRMNSSTPMHCHKLIYNN